MPEGYYVLYQSIVPSWDNGVEQLYDIWWRSVILFIMHLSLVVIMHMPHTGSITPRPAHQDVLQFA